MGQSDFIKQQKEKYKELPPCYCPILNETVHFTPDGLHHLLYNNRRPRKRKERYYRASLIDHIVEVIKNSNKATRETIKDTHIVLWSIEYLIKNTPRKQIVKVILKKNKGGKLKFLSTMRTKYIK